MKILLAGDTYPLNPWSRERLPAIKEALEGYDHELMDLFDFTGEAHKIRAEKREKEYFASNSINECNRKFLDVVRRHDFDTLVLGTLDTVSLFLHPITIGLLHDFGVKTVCFFGDDEFMLQRHSHWVERFDKCVTYVKWCADYYNNIVPGSTYYLPCGSYFPEKDFDKLPKEKEGDVVFVGSSFDNPEGERPTHLRELINNGFDVSIYGGDGWARMHDGFFIPHYRGYLHPLDVVPVINKYKISLSFLGDHIDGSPHMNANIWTTAPAGVACLSTYYEPLFTDYGFTPMWEIDTFHNPNELRAKTNAILSDSRVWSGQGKNLFEYVKENFNMVNLYKDFFKSLEAL